MSLLLSTIRWLLFITDAEASSHFSRNITSNVWAQSKLFYRSPKSYMVNSPSAVAHLPELMIRSWRTRYMCRLVMEVVLIWASCQIRKIAGCACAGNAGNVFPCRQFQRKPLVSDPGMHHGTCVTHVPWCMSGSLTCDDGENVPGIPGACAPAILRIWQEAHVHMYLFSVHSVYM